MANAFNYKQNVFYISNFGVNLLAFYYEWPLYSLSIKQLDYELAFPKTRSAGSKKKLKRVIKKKKKLKNLKVN